MTNIREEKYCLLSDVTPAIEELQNEIGKLKNDNSMRNRERCKKCKEINILKIDDDIILWLKEFAEYKLPEDSRSWDGKIAQRLLNQLGLN